MPRVLAISPHLDDAAFSAGGTLARLAAAGWETEVATVFAASVPDPRGFALACQLDKGLPAAADYMAIRRAEDAAACGALGARSTWLPLREAPHRGYGSPSELFGPLRPDDSVGEAVTTALAILLSDRRPDLIMAPQAIGGHVDHVEVVRALDRLAPAQPILWWTDWPYADRPRTHPAKPFAAVMDTLPALTLGFDPAPKRAGCAAYATQIRYQFGGDEGLDRALGEAGGKERFRVRGAAEALLGGVLSLAADGLRT